MSKPPDEPVMSNEHLLHTARVFIEDLQATVDKLTDEVRGTKEELDEARRMVKERDKTLAELTKDMDETVSDLIDAQKKLAQIKEIVDPTPTSQPDDSNCPVPPQ